MPNLILPYKNEKSRYDIYATKSNLKPISINRKGLARASTCLCFNSKDGNQDRINWLLNKIKELNIQGVIYYVVRGCILYAMEYTRIKKVLDRINVPVYYLDTEYTREDVGQIKTRVEAFLEMLTARIDF